jgi:hypothetical protein
LRFDTKLPQLFDQAFGPLALGFRALLFCGNRQAAGIDSAKPSDVVHFVRALPKPQFPTEFRKVERPARPAVRQRIEALAAEHFR